MAYQTKNQDLVRDKNFMRYAGYDYTSTATTTEQFLFSDPVINLIQNKCKELLRGIDPYGRDIIIQKPTICDMLDTIWANYQRQNIGDIYTIFNIPPDNKTLSSDEIIDQAIEAIVANVSADLGMRVYNSTLTKWTIVYGYLNEHGLRGHDIIKVQEKRPAPMQFNMNY